MIRQPGKGHGEPGLLHIVLIDVYGTGPTKRRRLIKRVSLCGFVTMICPGNNHSQEVCEDDTRCPVCRRLWVARGNYTKTPTD